MKLLYGREGIPLNLSKFSHNFNKNKNKKKRRRDEENEE